MEVSPSIHGFFTSLQVIMTDLCPLDSSLALSGMLKTPVRRSKELNLGAIVQLGHTSIHITKPNLMQLGLVIPTWSVMVALQYQVACNFISISFHEKEAPYESCS